MEVCKEIFDNEELGEIEKYKALKVSAWEALGEGQFTMQPSYSMYTVVRKEVKRR